MPSVLSLSRSSFDSKPFGASCKDIKLINDHRLSALCLNLQGEYVPSTLDLNAVFANHSGYLDWDGHGFYATVQGGIKLHGTWLSASMGLPDSHVLVWFDLNLCIQNIDGKLMFRKPTPNIADSCTLFSLGGDGKSGKTLSALCLAKSGELKLATLDLEPYLSNYDGRLEFGNDAAKGSEPVKDCHLDGFILHAELKRHEAANGQPDQSVLATCDLSRYIENSNGRLVVKKKHLRRVRPDRRDISMPVAIPMPIIAAPILAMDFTPKVVSHNNRLVWSDEMASHIGSERRFIDSLPAVTSATKHTDAVLKIGMLLGVFQGPIGAALAATLAADELIRTEGRGDENPRSIFPCSEEVFCGLRQFVEPRLVRFLGSTDAEDLREAVNEERAKANLEEITRDHMEGVADDFRRWFGK